MSWQQDDEFYFILDEFEKEGINNEIIFYQISKRREKILNLKQKIAKNHI